MTNYNKSYAEKIIEKLYQQGLDYEERAKEIERLHLDESSLSRVWQHVENPKRAFGVISASRHEYSKEENRERHEELRGRIRELGYGYIELDGGYREKSGRDSYVIVQEPSFFIPNVKYRDLISLGQELEQDSVIYKGLGEFRVVSTRPPVGETLVNFSQGKGYWNIDLAKEAVKEFFSSLVKGSHKGRKFVFKADPKRLTAPTSESYSESGVYFFIREKQQKSVQSHYYTDDPRWSYIYLEAVEEEDDDK